MASPVRFPSGLGTFPPKSTLSTYPISTSPRQIALTDDFIPYRAGDFTVTTAVAGTVAAFSWLSGAIKLATSASATDTIFLQRSGAAFQLVLGNQFWFDMKVAYPRTVLNANDTNIYYGLGDAATFALSNNFIGFVKPSGGTALNFVIKKAGTSTTFSNIGDLSLPSGIFGDPNAATALITSTIAGNAFTAVSVNTAGAGYQNAPLILSTITAGVAGNVPVFAQLGSTAYSANNPSVGISSTQLPYGSVVAPYLTNPGSGYTNGGPLTTLLEVEPVIDLQFYLDPKGVLLVGINGRTVMRIEGTATSLGQTGFAAGATVNTQTAGNGPTYYSTTQLSTSVAPFQPPIGNAINVLPLVPMNVLTGMTNTTANIRTAYVMEYNVAAELKTTFASHYSAEISLIEALRPDVVAAYNRRATGEKFLITPWKG